MPWLELLAEDVLAFRPRVPHRSPVAEERCEVCKDLAARLAEKAADKARAKVDKTYGVEAKRVAGAWRAVLERARARP